MSTDSSGWVQAVIAGVSVAIGTVVGMFSRTYRQGEAQGALAEWRRDVERRLERVERRAGLWSDD